jgi:hypothetical protein
MSRLPDGFMDFWNFWKKTKRHTDGPNKNKLQLRYQEALDKGATPEDILLAAHWHVRNFKDLEWIELAATWLNADCWMDEAQQERAFQARQAERLQQRASNVVRLPEPEKIITPEERARVAARMAELARSLGKREA